MEIDLRHAGKAWLWAGVTILALAGLVALGRAFTPLGDGVLTWQEWQVRKLQRAYQTEHSQLLQDALTLTELLNQVTPDPARVQVQLDAMRSRWQQSRVASLVPARTALEQAAQAVQSWSIGLAERDLAIRAVQNALMELEE